MNCTKHITYKEIERFVNLKEEDISMDDLDFLEMLGDRLEECEICSELYRNYNLHSLLKVYEEFGENYESITDDISFQTDIADMITFPVAQEPKNSEVSHLPVAAVSKLSEVATIDPSYQPYNQINKAIEKLTSRGETPLDIADYLIILQLASTFRLRGVKRKDGGNSPLNDAKQLVNIIQNPNESVFTIEIADRQGDEIYLPIITLNKTDAGKKYRLYVWNTSDELMTEPKEYNFEQMISEEGTIYAIYVTAPDLGAGTYQAIVSEVPEND